MAETCVECGETLIGRVDKRFCSDYCRSTHYNKINKAQNKVISGVNKVLKKNYLILKELNPNGKIKVKRDEVLRRGYDFGYLTSIYVTKAGKTYHFVYDQGYVELDDGYLAIVEKQEYT